MSRRHGPPCGTRGQGATATWTPAARSAAWTASSSGSSFVALLPEAGASFSEPNSVGDDGPPDLARVTILQIHGNWAVEEALDLELDAVLAVPEQGELARLRDALAGAGVSA